MAESRTVEQFARDIRSLKGDRLFQVLKPTLKLLALDAEAEVKDAYMNSGLKKPSGNLYNSIAGTVRKGSAAKRGFADIVVSAGGRQPGGRSVRYARAQEEGATISSRKGGFLAIPNKWDGAVASKLFQGSGQPRYASARDYPEPLRFVRAGNSLTLRNREGQVVYFLKKSVTIRGRHFMRDGTRQAAKRVPTLISRAVRHVVVSDG